MNIILKYISLNHFSFFNYFNTQGFCNKAPKRSIDQQLYIVSNIYEYIKWCVIKPEFHLIFSSYLLQLFILCKNI